MLHDCSFWTSQEIYNKITIAVCPPNLYADTDTGECISECPDCDSGICYPGYGGCAATCPQGTAGINCTGMFCMVFYQHYILLVI